MHFNILAYSYMGETVESVFTLTSFKRQHHNYTWPLIPRRRNRVAHVCRERHPTERPGHPPTGSSNQMSSVNRTVKKGTREGADREAPAACFSSMQQTLKYTKRKTCRVFFFFFYHFGSLKQRMCYFIFYLLQWIWMDLQIHIDIKMTHYKNKQLQLTISKRRCKVVFQNPLTKALRPLAWKPHEGQWENNTTYSQSSKLRRTIGPSAFCEINMISSTVAKKV